MERFFPPSLSLVPSLQQLLLFHTHTRLRFQEFALLGWMSLSLSLTKWATTTQGHCGPGKAGELGDGPPGALRPAWSRKSQMVSGLRDGVSVCAWVQAPAPCVPATWPRPHSSLTHIGRRRAEAQAVSCHVDILCPPLGSVSRATARNTCLGRHPHCPGPLRALS